MGALLDEGEVLVWWVRPARLGDAQLSRLRACMSPEERARAARLPLASVRRDFEIARGLVRSTLSRCGSIAPSDWCFEASAHGRPRVSGPAAVEGLHFSLSHAGDLVVCAVARRREIGVDVEDVTRETDTDGVAERFFSGDERRAMRALPPDRQRERFFDYWTLKESYLKARGLGLRLALARLSFDLGGPDRPIRVSFGAGIHDDPGRWRFSLLRPTSVHRVALAVARS